VTDEVSTDVDVGAPGAAGRGRRTTLQLRWKAADPFAVLLLVSAQPDHPALPRGEWVVLRDFLRYGLEEPTGDGEVRLRPDIGDTMLLSLARAGRPCQVSVPGQVVREFLDATERIVPTGEERSEDALDELIERLLRT